MGFSGLWSRGERRGGSICFGCSGKPKECKHSEAKVRVSTLVDLLVELIRASFGREGQNIIP